MHTARCWEWMELQHSHFRSIISGVSEDPSFPLRPSLMSTPWAACWRRALSFPCCMWSHMPLAALLVVKSPLRVLLCCCQGCNPPHAIKRQQSAAQHTRT
jgi:hypothetical protein